MNANEITAFPVVNLSDGMSLRDYFAAKAMQAIIAKAPFSDSSCDDFDWGLYAGVSLGAYYYADAMLKARQE